ncbi:hypothetical protein C621_0210510 [Bacillus thuringiensis serovar aizawai str. Leapi01]|nr:hypothetical protein C621_0210510 [Bacillus thuringiensis serovar aizawai str. Leapi01]ETE98390.1 hypothetical protein C623_0209660 [Bacillus thuringiensis serovar aizawai str. Hu4-2]
MIIREGIEVTRITLDGMNYRFQKGILSFCFVLDIGKLVKK